MRGVRHHPGVGLVVEEVPVPHPSDDEVLVRVLACGLCGTDAEIVFGERHPPRPVTLGHEIAGVVEGVGGNVDSALVGRRVVVTPIVSCGSCGPCATGRASLCREREVIGLHRDGGLAELVVVPARNALRLPEPVSMEQGAIATDAVATPFHALVDRGRLSAGEVVVVFGIGGLGQHAIQIARASEASRIVAVDPRPEARAIAIELGADVAVDSAAPDADASVIAATGGHGADVSLGFAGGEAVIESMLSCLDAGGRAVMVAMTHEASTITQPGAMVQKETSLLGSYGFSPATVTTVLDLVASGRLRLDRSISHLVGLDDVGEMLGALHAGRGDVRRVVVHPNGAPDREKTPVRTAS